MLTIGADLRKWTPLLLLLCICSLPTTAFAESTNETISPDLSGSGASTAATATKHTTSSPATFSTSSSSSSSSFAPIYPDTACPFRTINYITHTLPQQCLKTNWGVPSQHAGLVNGSATEDDDPPSPQIVIPWARPGAEKGGAQANPDDANPTTESIQAEHPISTGTATDVGSISIQPEGELETDSPLDNENFLSFEEWKRKNLEQAGQSPENIGQGRAASESKPRQRPVNVNALDSLGDEGEIELDFSGFGSPDESEDDGGNTFPGTQGAGGTKDADEDDKVAPGSWLLSKDAGKTCKERFNYASFDCAATVLKTNRQAKSTSSVLVENKDSYMLNECSAENKFVIVELCDDILVDTVVLANYEFFSSMFRHFRVSVSDRYPVKMDRWRDLGTFEARNSRDIQPFLITEPQIWARYLRIEFLTHYGNEFYCPISLLRVHGTTMMEQFRREEEEARGVDDFAEPIESAEGAPVQTPSDNRPITIDQVPVQLMKDDGSGTEAASKTVVATEGDDASMTSAAAHSKSDISEEPSAGSTEPLAKELSSASQDSDSTSNPAADYSQASSSSATSRSGAEEPNPYVNISNTADSSSTTKDAVSYGPSRSPTSDDKAISPPAIPNQNNSAGKQPTNDTASAPSTPSSVKAPNNTVNSAPSQPRGSSTQPNMATPTTQESFFKSISKRLQQLEANSTLSLQYIEEQSRILRDAFVKVEKRQLTKTEKFLDHLNSTVMQELKSYRSMYDQLWQSTILELEGMKERQRTEVGEIGARLSLMADELVWQKRMAVVQSTLLLLCLGLVLFVRSGTLGSQSDIPIVQQLGNKYSSFFDSPPGSPENTRTIRRRRTFRNMWRSDTSVGLSERSGHHSDGVNVVSDAETDGLRSPVRVEFSPPTPDTPYTAPSRLEPISSPLQTHGLGPSEHVDLDTGLPTPTEEYMDTDLDDQAKRIQVLETQSGPATPRGSRDSRPSWEEVDRAVGLLKAEEQGHSKGAENEAQRTRKRRSPLRRFESYNGVDDSPDDDSGEDLLMGV